ncbi:MAG: DUF4258 domain-containing protein [Solirubrobacterales bacterium]|nr:DUF4258 domain-containing protein [Solirubrobacterales bacterium]MBV9165751.1 DUF4258 domain-containing protein [Solirubrobacterales bacterium]MBV9534022.1 DUF4258 domain-containing protein [Solirubrobacterales bacterium]
MTADFVQDPDGRRVELTAERWQHILEAHAEIDEHRDEIMRAVRNPDHRLPGREANEEWFLIGGGAGPSRWLQVVVAYGEDRGWIVTAFARRSLPRQA